ncbi:MAG: hypothetical protein EPN47_00975 [Acidobacteria bacterium]|nr:MAG: hypothetical protein EPN47_00975 [Acidobacteriota bacterium]
MQRLISDAKLAALRYLMPAAVLSLVACGVLAGILGVTTEASPSQQHIHNGISPMAASVFQSKLIELSSTGAVKGRSLNPITITDDEVNSFFKYDRPQFLPPGVKDLDFHFKPDGIHGAANVNFDQLKSPQQTESPMTARLLASIFQGTQHLTALGVLESNEGTGTLMIKDVHIGSTVLSDWLVNFLIHTYVESEYKIDLSKPFLLPNHVRRVEFAPGKAIFVRGVKQK